MKLQDESLAMQERCVHCSKEQYAPAVYSISKGERGCEWCGKKSEPMTQSEWMKRNE